MNEVITIKTKKIGPFLAKMLILFMLVYKCSVIPGITLITTELLVFVILTGYLVVNKKAIGNRSVIDMYFRNNILMQIILLTYSLILICLFGAGNGVLFAKESAIFLLFVPIIYLGLTNMLRSLDELMRILLVITLLQCVIISLGMIFQPIADWIDTSVFNEGITHMGGYAGMRQMGYPGGIGCIAAKGSMQLSLGLVACFYFVEKRGMNWQYCLNYVFITIVMTAVSRTGLILSIVVIIVYIFTKHRGTLKVGKGAIYAVFVISGLLLALLILLKSPVFNGFLKEQFMRVDALFDKGIWDSFLKFYFYGSDTVIPPLTWETFWGLGILSGTSGSGITINADGAFIKMYAAVGPLLTIAFHICLFQNMRRSIHSFDDKQLQRLGWLFVWIMVIGEFKEWFFYTRYMILLFYVFAFLAEHKKNELGGHCDTYRNGRPVAGD